MAVDVEVIRTETGGSAVARVRPEQPRMLLGSPEAAESWARRLAEIGQHLLEHGWDDEGTDVLGAAGALFARAHGDI